MRRKQKKFQCMEIWCKPKFLKMDNQQPNKEVNMISKQEFIQRLINKYNDKVNDIEILEYNGIYKPIIYKCKICGTEEKVTGRSLLERHSNSLCKNCDNPLSYRKREKENQGRIKQLFKNSDKSLHFVETFYRAYDNEPKHNHLVVKYYCDKCQQISEIYLKDLTNLYFSCRHCGERARMTPEDFQRWFNLYYDDKFILLDGEKYKDLTTRLHVKCKECGFIFNPTVTSLKRSRKILCPKCRHGRSNQEIYIGDWLTKNNIDFDSEVNFKWLPNSHMRYDFVLFKNNLIIEYDGEQHFKYTPHFHKNYEEFLRHQKNDEIKNQLAIEHGFSILRIPYNYKDKIKNILTNLFGSTTIPNGSRGKLLEIDSILTQDEDIV